jgi:hypothetical protein
MLSELPRQCDIGAKKNSQGNEQYWRGYKFHLDVADGQVPISAVLTSASVHDSQVAIPLVTLTSQRVVHLYELMDSAYDADDIHAHSRQLNHVPIIAPHPRRGTKKSSQLPKVFPDKIDIGETSVDAGRTHPKADFHGSFCGSVLARLWEPAVGQADRDELSRSRTAGSA